MRFVLAMCVLALQLQAQEPAPVTVEGTIVDDVGAVVPRLEIKFKSTQSPSKFTAAADEEGKYVIKLPAGEYLVQTSLRCIGSYKQRKSIKQGRDVKLDIKLRHDPDPSCSAVE